VEAGLWLLGGGGVVVALLLCRLAVGEVVVEVPWLLSISHCTEKTPI